jgi:hypothetical protein
MTSREFCYWLQGYFELAASDGTPVISNAKADCIQKHLAMVFKHEIDPSYPQPGVLGGIHNPTGSDLLVRC